MRYFLGLTLPESLSHAITESRKLFGAAGERTIQRLEPHITLVLPFTTEIEPTLLTKQLKDSVTNQEPFELTTTKVDSFRRGMYYLGLKPSKSLASLQKTLYKTVETDSRYQFVRDRYVFRPHITIVGHLADNEYRASESLANTMVFSSVSWNVTDVTLFRYDVDHWERDVTIPLAS